MTEPARFDVTPASGGRPPVVTAAGDIDLANVGDFENVLAAAVNGNRELVVNLTGVSYCDSSAVRALFTVAAATSLTMVVRHSGHIAALLGISGLDRVATVITEE